MNICDLKPTQRARILSVGGDGSLRQHFLDMGLIPGSEITVIKYAPMGDPIELRIQNYELTLRVSDAARIQVEPLPENQTQEKQREGMLSQIPHPGLGEGGHYHVKSEENPLSDDTILRFALVGNQNSGKTTLFNQLTGSNQHVGNFPGVTVDRKSGVIRGHNNTEVTDLPGIYSLSPYTSEEIISRQFILDEKPTGIINIVDATNIERNLYLTMQLMELDVPMVLALNMMDEVRENGGTILINEMEAMLGIPVIPISAITNEGVDELIQHALYVSKYQKRPRWQDFCDKNDKAGALHRCLHGIMHLIEDHAARTGISARFAATKLTEGDYLVKEALGLDPNEEEMIEHIICQMENEVGLDRNATIADMRFQFIRKLTEATVIQPAESRGHIRSRRIDRLLTGRYTAIPCFILIMATVFYLTFNVLGAWLQEQLEVGISWVGTILALQMEAWKVSDSVCSLVVDGIFAGVGSVLSFLPVIVVLFFFLSLLEDTGYMARVAFVMDKPLRRIGLSGRSIVPMLIGFGCTVPGVMATRTLPSDRDRKMTILLTPFMSCSAKLPIYGFFANAFFPDYSGFIMIGLYLFGILTGILFALISKKAIFKGEAVPFVMELPNYRLPGAKNMLLLLWEKAKDFLQRAFTVIFIASIAIWFLQNYNLRLHMISDPVDSILALVAGVIAPIFVPLGFGSWQITTALLSGFLAKESVVATLNVLLPSEEALHNLFSVDAALPLLVFCLLYTPCVAAIAAIRRELGGKWAMLEVVGQCGIAWICAFIVRLICMIFVQ